jgi:translocation and assembly module TamB
MRLRTLALRGALLLALLAAALAIGLYWASRSEAVLAWGVERLAARLPGKLTLTGLRGALDRPIAIAALDYEQDGLRVSARNVALDWAPWALLLTDQLSIRNLSADSVTLTTRGGGERKRQPPDNLRLPLAVRVDRLALGALRIEGGAAPLKIGPIALRYEGGPQRHELRLERLVSQWGELAGTLRLKAERPFALEGDATIRSAALPDWPLQAKVGVQGTLEDIRAQGELMLRELPVTAQARVAPFQALPLAGMTLHATGIELAALVEGAPNATLELTVEGAQAAARALHGTVSARNLTPGTLDAKRLPMQGLSALFAAEPGLLQLTQAQLDLGEAGRASGAATLRSSAESGGAGASSSTGIETQLAVQQLDLRKLHAALRETALSGTIEVRHAQGVQHIRADLAQQGMRATAALIHGHGLLQVQSLGAQRGAARIDASGQIATAAPHAYAVQAELRRVNPAEFGDFPALTLNGSVQAHGELRPEWSAQLAYRLRDGAWRGHRLAGEGKLSLAPGRAHGVNARVNLGRNTLQLAGAYGGRGDRMDFELSAPALSALGREWGGRAQAAGRLEGTPAQPAVNATLSAADLRTPQSFGAQTLRARIALGAGEDPPIELDAQGSGLRARGLTLETARAQAAGTRGRHRLEIAAVRAPFDATAQLEGGLARDLRSWTGRLLALDNRGDHPFALEAPAPLSLSPTRTLFGPALVQSTHARLELGETVYDRGRLRSQGAITGLRLASLLDALGKVPAVQTDLVLNGSWTLDAGERVNGRIELARQSGDVTVRVDEEQLAAGFERLTAALDVTQDRVRATLVANAANAGVMSAEAHTVLSRRNGAWGVAGNAPLRVAARANVATLKPLVARLARGVAAEGRLAFELQGSGTVAEPSWTGQATGEQISIEQVRNGLFLRDGALRAEFAGDRIELRALSVRGGDGRFEAKGTLTLGSTPTPAKARPAFSIDWSANKLAVAQRPDLLLVATGSGTLSGNEERIALRGEARMDRGRVELRDESAPALGSDVVVKGAKTRVVLPEPVLRPAVDFGLDLGRDFHVKGRGLDARVEGRLRLVSPGNAPLRAEGEIQVARGGTYDAFGRKLDIDPGKLYFAGPLDNPGLDIRAMRKSQQVEAGVEVTGTARDPRVRLVSDPEVPDVEKLAWLTLGRPIEAGNQSDAQTLQRYAAVLATAVGTGSFQSRVAQRVGLDEVTLTPSMEAEAPGGVLTLGKRLSDRIYVMFEQNLSAAESVFKLNYQLSRRWSVRTESGTQTDAVDLFYTWSFD